MSGVFPFLSLTFPFLLRSVPFCQDTPGLATVMAHYWGHELLPFFFFILLFHALSGLCFSTSADMYISSHI